MISFILVKFPTGVLKIKSNTHLTEKALSRILFILRSFSHA